jgi:hypothetical protein
MTLGNSSRAALAGAILAAACAAAHAQTRTMVLSPGVELAFDFSGSPDGGAPSGNFNNFAFRLDLDRPKQSLSVRSGEQRRDVVSSYDYADCSRSQEGLLEHTVSSLAPGTPTFVDYVDIEMIPFLQKDLAWSGGVCYGFRTRVGWQWRLASTPLVYDAAANVVRARIWVKQPDVDALKLVFDYSVPRQSVRSVRVTTQPPQISIVK